MHGASTAAPGAPYLGLRVRARVRARVSAHLVRGKVRADEGYSAAVQREGHRHSALVAAHTQHAACDAGSVDFPRVRLQQRQSATSMLWPSDGFHRNFRRQLGPSVPSRKLPVYMHALRRLSGLDKPTNGSMLGRHGTWLLPGNIGSSWPG